MRIEACFERDTFEVREVCSPALRIVCDEALTPGDKVEVQFPNTWCLVSGPSFTRTFQAADPAAPHHVSLSAPGVDAAFRIDITERQLNYPEGLWRHGRLLTATLERGEAPAGVAMRFVYANTFAPNRSETEEVYLRVRGQAPVMAPRLVVTPGPGESLRVIAPSSARPGQEFHVLVVSLDRFENASSTVFCDEKLTLDDGTVMSGPLSFQGRARVAVTLAKGGVYRFRFGDVVSNAVRVGENLAGVLWGDIHIHTKLSHDAQGNDPYGYARDVSGLDFGAACDHWDSLGPEGYAQKEAWIAEADARGDFVALPADERNPRGLTGHHNIYFRTVEAFRAARQITPNAEKPEVDEEAEALGKLDPADAMLIPHHTGIAFGGVYSQLAGGARPGGSNAVDWDAWPHRDRLCPLVEIYSHHGQSEKYDPQHCLAYEFNRMRNPERRANTSTFGPYYAQEYWKAGHRFGVIGSSDEHSGQGGRRHGGIAGVYADEPTRDALWQAMRARRTFATTGERILLDFSVGGGKMGEVVRAAKGDAIPIRLAVWGTALLLRVEVLRFRFGVDEGFQPVLSHPPRPESMDAEMAFEDTFEGPCMYYARITQEPLEWPAMAWSSPVWVDRA